MPASVSTVATASGVRSAAHAKRTLLARHHIVAPSLRVADAAAGSVFSAARASSALCICLRR